MKNAGYALGLAIILAISASVLAQPPDSGTANPPPPKVAVAAPVVPVPGAPTPVLATKAAVPAPTPTPTAAPAPAVAVPAPATAPEMTWWKVLIRYGLELIFTILGIMATAFVTVLMRKYGFEDYTAKVNDLLDRGTGYAEQKSLNALKLNGKPLGSAEKLALALELIGEKAKEYKLPDKGKEWWEKKVEGWLGSSKLANGK